MSNIELRRATISDAALIAQISRRTFVETYAQFNTPQNMELFMEQQFAEQKLVGQVLDTRHIFLLAFDGNIPAGYIFLKKDENNTDAMEVARLYMCAGFIGKGVGRSLMNAAIGVAKELGKKKIWLGVWEHNQRAIRFYQRAGFTRTGQQNFLLGEDLQNDWVMERPIA